jgi:predicted RNA-binding Zn-ribbon protein involved in translation (DUF1610 family)
METIEAQSVNIVTQDFLCPKCGKGFKSSPALRMHTVRAHGKGWDTTANLKNRKGNKEEQLEHRRVYQRELRARYYREGKNSKGELMPKGWKARPRGGNSGMKLPKWSPERLAKFRRTMRKKALLRNKPTERIQIVYPDPREEQQKINEAIANTWPSEKDIIVPTLKYCPNCGEHLEGWRHQS